MRNEDLNVPAPTGVPAKPPNAAPEFAQMLVNLAAVAKNPSRKAPDSARNHRPSRHSELPQTHYGNNDFPAPQSGQKITRSGSVRLPEGAVPTSGVAIKTVQWKSRSDKKRSLTVGPHRFKVDLSAQWEDLLKDEFISNAPRIQFEERVVPALGGIPLLRKIGQGGMGAVYYGLHCGFGIEVAVKVLPFHLALKDGDAVKRFFREARLAIDIKSEHLVSVMDVAQEAGISFLVMEFVAGKSAGELLRQARLAGQVGLPERACLEICIAACKGLVEAHAKNVIHRDVKPDNILIPNSVGTKLDYSRCKVADLGLARNENSSHSMTGANVCLGTPGFMSPEQIEDAHEARKPSDVFGLGATLYALLCGDAPFADDLVMTVINDTLKKQHDPVRSRRGDVSKSTATVIDVCLAKDPSNRYADAAGLLKALRACLTALIDPQAANFLDIHGPLVHTQNDALKNTPVPARAIRSSLGKNLGLVAAGVFVVLGGLLSFGIVNFDQPRPVKPAAPLLSISALENDEQDADKKFAESDRLNQQQLHSADAKLKSLVDSKSAADRDQKKVIDLAKAEFNALMEEAQLAADKKEWSRADDLLKKSAASAGASYFPETPGSTLLANQVKAAISKQQMNTEMVKLRDDVIAVLSKEPLDEFGRAAHLSVARRSEIDAQILRLRNFQAQQPELEPLLKRLDRNISIDIPSAGRLDMVLVSPGEFTMGNAQWKPGSGAEHEHPVKISKPFYITKNLIQMSQFRRFVDSENFRTDAEKGTVPFDKGALGIFERKLTWNPSLSWRKPGFSIQDDHPVVCVSAQDCAEYSLWISKRAGRSLRLPTEAEWEYAARGEQNRQWPWGDTWEGARCNHADATLKNSGSFESSTFSTDSDGSAFTSPVGKFDNASWCGAKDMAGNVSQWCADWYSEFAYVRHERSDPQGPDTGDLKQFLNSKEPLPSRVIRGGSFMDPADMQRATARKNFPEKWRAVDIGFRLVMNLKN